MRELRGGNDCGGGQTVNFLQLGLCSDLSEAVIYPDKANRYGGRPRGNFRNCRTQSANNVMIFRNDEPLGFGGTARYKLNVKRLPRKHIDDAGVYALRSKQFSGI
jgi:hypothetical protein